MDFFERQEKCRRNTKLLEVYFALAVIGVIASVYLAALFVAHHYGIRHGRYDYSNYESSLSLWDPQLFLWVAIPTLALILGGTIYKIQRLAGGGSVVAEMLGGRLILPNTADPDEHRLRNVVEEMAIASGTPVPQIFVIDEQRGINAFAAGHSTSDMAVCVTRGALKLLTRDELQGVIGHEFSHILNGDMRLNLRLMGLVFGILCLTLFGRILLQTRGRRNPLPLAGLVLILIGSIGVFFAKLIKSAVNRQREFLADASAVQFTRNPAGLAGALKKIGSCGSRIDDSGAEDASHLFFANGLSESFLGLFSTHPPLDERIRALDPGFDGRFTPVDFSLLDDRGAKSQSPTVIAPGRGGTSSRLGDLIGGAMVATAMRGPSPPGQFAAHAGAVTPQHLDYAADLRSKLPLVLTDAAREPMSAIALVFAMLISPDEAMRKTQLDQLQQRLDPGMFQEMSRLLSATAALDSRARLPLAVLAVPALRRLSPGQYAQFEDDLKFIIESDQQVELFEFMLQKLVMRQLDPHFQPPRRPVVQYYVLKPLLPDCVVLLSALACAGSGEPAAIQSAFQQGAAQLGIDGLSALERHACGLDQVETALEHLNQGAPLLKKQVLNACGVTVAADGVIQEYEAELLRAIADALDCPIPPFLGV